jgi:hypothetical protein
MIGDAPEGAGGREIVKDDGDAIGRQLDVEFEKLGAHLNRYVECGDRVLWGVSGRAAMGDIRYIPERPGREPRRSRLASYDRSSSSVHVESKTPVLV